MRDNLFFGSILRVFNTCSTARWPSRDRLLHDIFGYFSLQTKTFFFLLQLKFLFSSCCFNFNDFISTSSSTFLAASFNLAIRADDEQILDLSDLFIPTWLTESCGDISGWKLNLNSTSDIARLLYSNSSVSYWFCSEVLLSKEISQSWYAWWTSEYLINDWLTVFSPLRVSNLYRC